MGKVSINLSLTKIWQSWYLFRRSKKIAPELDKFQYYLEKNLFNLCLELKNGKWSHGRYREYVVYDNKKRKISVALIRDRIVHRLIYEFLVNIYDKAFDYDVWSCRKGKGLWGAINRTQKLANKYIGSFVWRADIKKFFDNVDHDTLKNVLKRKITCCKTLEILGKIIDSYARNNEILHCDQVDKLNCVGGGLKEKELLLVT